MSNCIDHSSKFKDIYSLVNPPLMGLTGITREITNFKKKDEEIIVGN